jgi:hypothetical protein
MRSGQEPRRFRCRSACTRSSGHPRSPPEQSGPWRGKDRGAGDAKGPCVPRTGTHPLPPRPPERLHRSRGVSLPAGGGSASYVPASREISPPRSPPTARSTCTRRSSSSSADVLPGSRRASWRHSRVGGTRADRPQDTARCYGRDPCRAIPGICHEPAERSLASSRPECRVAGMASGSASGWAPAGEGLTSAAQPALAGRAV